MKYKLLDINDVEYELNDGVLIPSVIKGSMARSTDTFNFSQDIIKRSFLPGSVVVGSSRLEAKAFTFNTEYVFNSDIDFDAYLNKLIMFLESAVTLQDVTNNKQSSIAVMSVSAPYSIGSVKRSGKIAIKMTMLDGFWTDITPVSIVQTLGAGVTNIALSNTGYLKTYALINIVVLGLVPQLDIQIDETKEGLQLIDSTLGQATLDNLIIDNVAGTLMIADFDRTQSITIGTGFFPIPIGDSTLIIDSQDNGLELDFSYYRRYYI